MSNNSTIADELAIRNLLAMCARESDTGEIDGYLVAFAEDAVIEIPGTSVRQGHDEIRTGSEALHASGRIGPGTNSMHVLGASEIRVDGDRATGFTPFLFVSGAEGSPKVTIIGRYADEYVRTPDGWRIAHRRIESA